MFPMSDNQKGFALISVIFIMLLMAVMVFSINYYSITQLRVASNHTAAVQVRYDLKAVVQSSIWQLTDNMFWRVSDGDAEDTYTFDKDTIDERTYHRIVGNASQFPHPPGFNPDDFADTVTIQVTPPGATQVFQRSFRYYIETLPDLSFSTPERISINPDGSLLIADSLNHRVIRVDPTDTSSPKILAGTGIAGGGYDYNTWFGIEWGGSLPMIDTPTAICADPSKPEDSYDYDYYIAESGGNRVSKLWWESQTVGYIETAAGDISGDVYNGDPEEDISARDAKLTSPEDVFVDASNQLYIADTGSFCIRKVDLGTSKITTFAGSLGSKGDIGDGGPATSAQFKSPGGIFMDAFGNLFIADSESYRIRKVDTSGNISTVAGNGFQGDTGDGGPATSARLRFPKDIFVDGNGNIFIADKQSNKIRVVSAVDGNIYTLAGTGGSGDTVSMPGAPLPAVKALLKDPSGIAMASAYGGARIYISDTSNDKIKVLKLRTVPEL